MIDDFRHAVSIPEGRGEGGYLVLSDHRANEVVDLMHEALDPPDRMAALHAAIPPEVGQRVLRLDDLDGAKPLIAALRNLKLVQLADLVAERAAVRRSRRPGPGVSLRSTCRPPRPG